MDLETAYAEESPGRCSDFRRIIRKSAQVVPEDRSRGRELRSSELHAITGIACKTDRDIFQISSGFLSH
jgi:hypothetical protein